MSSGAKASGKHLIRQASSVTSRCNPPPSSLLNTTALLVAKTPDGCQLSTRNISTKGKRLEQSHSVKKSPDRTWLRITTAREPSTSKVAKRSARRIPARPVPTSATTQTQRNAYPARDAPSPLCWHVSGARARCRPRHNVTHPPGVFPSSSAGRAN